MLNTAFANNVEKYVQAYTKKHELHADAVETLTENVESVNSPQSDVTSGLTSSVENPNTLQWHPSDFYASMLNYSLGFGTVLGFPRLCYKHGGGRTRLFFGFYFFFTSKVHPE